MLRNAMANTIIGRPIITKRASSSRAGMTNIPAAATTASITTAMSDAALSERLQGAPNCSAISAQ